jgi:hypothetical protein
VTALEPLDVNRRVLVTGGAGSGKTRLATAWARRAVGRGERILLVHACRHRPSMDVLAPRLTADNLLTDDAVRAVRETPVFDAIEVLLKGPEIPLGDGRSYDDKDGVPADPGQLPLLGSRRHDPAPRRRAAGRRHARSLRRFARRRLAPSLHGHDAGHLRALLAQRDARRQDARGRVRR